MAENNDGKEATAKEEIPGNDNSKPADEKGEMCPVKEPREVEEQGEGRAEHKTEEEEQGMLVAPKMEGELTEKKDENKEIAKEVYMRDKAFQVLHFLTGPICGS